MTACPLADVAAGLIKQETCRVQIARFIRKPLMPGELGAAVKEALKG